MYTNDSSLSVLFNSLKIDNDLIQLFSKLGLITTELHSLSNSRPPFKSDLSSLTPDQLSRELGYWTSEFGRISELIGLLNGQESLYKIKIKSSFALARKSIRESHPKDQKALTNSQLNDMAEENQDYLDLCNSLSQLNLLQAQFSAIKEVTSQYIQTLSREIAWRDAQIKGKIY